MDTLPIIPEMFTLMCEDDEDQSDRLLELYDQADEKGKALLDDALTCICGYNMRSLKERVS
jgi:hypothetical protein